jgi:methylenetetrahydrofolate reductase (NADPH)
MVKIDSILESGGTYSYEFFPPKDDLQAAALEIEIAELAVTRPDFISITYGALGSTREITKELAVSQNTRWDFPTMAHITCVGQDVVEISELVDEYALDGLENLLALRGDGEKTGDFAHAIDLVTFIKNRHPFMSVGVAAHPETHPESRTRMEDRQRLAAKLEVADFAITQFFFDTDHYCRLVDELDALGSNKPIIPGIMLFNSVNGLVRMARMNNTSLPKTFIERLESVNNQADLGKLAVESAVQMVDVLNDYGAPGFHIYTLNKSRPALELKKLIAW